jgi:hypothetical protein
MSALANTHTPTLLTESNRFVAVTHPATLSLLHVQLYTGSDSPSPFCLQTTSGRFAPTQLSVAIVEFKQTFLIHNFQIHIQI